MQKLSFLLGLLSVFFYTTDLCIASTSFVLKNLTEQSASKTPALEKPYMSYYGLTGDILRDNSSASTQIPTIEVPFINKAENVPTALDYLSFDEIRKLEHKGHRQKAIQLARISLKNTDNTDIRILLGLMLSWDKQYKEAREELQTVLKKSPGNSEACSALVNVELWSDNPKRALETVNYGLKYHPKDKTLLKQKENLLNKSISYEEIKKLAHSGQQDKARALAERYLKEQDNADVRVLLGLMYSWNKNYQEAEKHLLLVLYKKPDYSDASNALANVEIWQEHYSEALQTINKALKYSPHNSELLEKKAQILQTFNQNSYSPGIFNLANAVGPGTPGNKLNAFRFNQEVSYVDDLEQYWSATSIGYERYTPYGPVIFTVAETYRFEKPGTQYLVEAYPKFFKGAYAWVAYGFSKTSYLARNYYGLEPFFSLPNAFEVSAGERVLQFTNTTHLYTGSIAKYIGNYWFSLRPYFSAGRSRSYYLTARRYFSNPETYISITLGTGSGPSNFDFTDPNNISSDLTRSARLNGNIVLSPNFILTWLARASFYHFQNDRQRHQYDSELGFIWRF